MFHGNIKIALGLNCRSTFLTFDNSVKSQVDLTKLSLLQVGRVLHYEQVDHRLATCVPDRGFSNRAEATLSKGDAVQKQVTKWRRRTKEMKKHVQH